MATYTDTVSAIAAIKAHPACGEFVTMPGKYLVYYPFKTLLPGGVLVSRSIGDIAALNQLYDKIDSFWQSRS